VANNYYPQLPRLAAKDAHEPSWVVDSSRRHLASLFAPVPVRTATWIIALGWMGTACLLNAKQCGRTHCRYTGPYYLAMIAPVVLLGSGVVSGGIFAWLQTAGVILLGSMLLWRATERAWGKFF
jgi:hypothetical protein